MNNNNLTNVNHLREDVSINCSSSSLPNNSESAGHRTLFSDVAHGYGLQVPQVQPSNFYYYELNGHMNPQSMPPNNQLQLLSQSPIDSRYLQCQQRQTLGFPCHPSEFQNITSGLYPIYHGHPSQQQTPPYNVFRPEQAFFRTPQSEHLSNLPNVQQIYLPQPSQNLFPITSNQGFYPQPPLGEPAVLLDASTRILPSIRDCISFDPPDVPHNYEEFTAGFQSVHHSSNIVSENPTTNVNFLESQKSLTENQTYPVAQTSIASQPGVSSATGNELNINISQTIEVTVNLPGQNHPYRIIFVLENLLGGPYGSISTRVSSTVNINELLKRENGAENDPPTINSTDKQENENLTPATASQISLSDKNESTTSDNGERHSSSLHSLLNDESLRYPFLEATHEESSKENEKNEASKENQ